MPKFNDAPFFEGAQLFRVFNPTNGLFQFFLKKILIKTYFDKNFFAQFHHRFLFLVFSNIRNLD